MTTTQNDTIARGVRVALRRKRLSDAANDYAWRSDPDLARYDAARPLTISYADYLESYTEELLYLPALRKVYAVEDPQGRHIGNVMYYNIDLVRREAEIGITIGIPAYWGRGYGADALRLMADHVFTTTPLTRLYLHTLDWNVRAQRSFARAGFRECGRSRRGGYRFSVMELRREWRLPGPEAAPEAQEPEPRYPREGRMPAIPARGE